MRHAAKTYGAIAAQTANPRELEADLLPRPDPGFRAFAELVEARQIVATHVLDVDAARTKLVENALQQPRR
jgi:hypothetical protein